MRHKTGQNRRKSQQQEWKSGNTKHKAGKKASEERKVSAELRFEYSVRHFGFSFLPPVCQRQAACRKPDYCLY